MATLSLYLKSNIRTAHVCQHAKSKLSTTAIQHEASVSMPQAHPIFRNNDLQHTCSQPNSYLFQQSPTLKRNVNGYSYNSSCQLSCPVDHQKNHTRSSPSFLCPLSEGWNRGLRYLLRPDNQTKLGSGPTYYAAAACQDSIHKVLRISHHLPSTTPSAKNFVKSTRLICHVLSATVPQN